MLLDYGFAWLATISSYEVYLPMLVAYDLSLALPDYTTVLLFYDLCLALPGWLQQYDDLMEPT